MATWLVKIEGFKPAKYVETKVVNGKEIVVVDWSNEAQPPTQYRSKRNNTIQEYPLEICKIIRKPSPWEMKIRIFFARLFLFETRYWDWREEYESKFR
jgi:hypothetical protein